MTGRTNITDEEASATFADLTFLRHTHAQSFAIMFRVSSHRFARGKYFFVRSFVVDERRYDNGKTMPNELFKALSGHPELPACDRTMRPN
jgi:hypothetical protein